MVLRLEVYEEPIRGYGPIRLLDDHRTRFVHRGDYLRFVGKFSQMTEGYYAIEFDEQFPHRIANITYSGSEYQIFVNSDSYVDISLADYVPQSSGVVTQLRIGIPEDIMLYVKYPSQRPRFSFDRPGVTVNVGSSYDDRWIGAFTSEKSPFNEPKLELTLFYGSEYPEIRVYNDTDEIQKVVLNCLVNMLDVKYIGIEKPEDADGKVLEIYHPDLLKW